MFDIQSKSFSEFALAIPARVVRELGRMFRNHKWEATDEGDLWFPESRALIGGVGEVYVNGQFMEKGKNLWTTEGFNYMLAAGVGGSAAKTVWYFAPFSNSGATPAANWTAATFNGTATEITAYNEATRQAYVETTPSAGSINNTASPGTITATSAITIVGFGLLSSSTKADATAYPTQVLLSAYKYATAYALPTAGNTLGMKYTLTLANP